MTTRGYVLGAIAAAILAIVALLVASMTASNAPARVALVVSPVDKDGGNGTSPLSAVTLSETVRIFRGRLRELGVGQTKVVLTPAETITIELPAEDANHLQHLLLLSARFEMKLVLSGPAEDRQSLRSASNAAANGQVVVSGSLIPGRPQWYLVERTPALTGDDVQSSHVTTDEFGQPAVAFTLTAGGTRKMEAVTAANVGKELAILLDDQILSAPRIESAITQADGRITGRFTRAEAADVAFAMRAVPLPVPLHVVEQRFLPAAPGRSSIHGVAVASAAVFSVGTLALFAVAFLRSSPGPRAGAPT